MIKNFLEEEANKDDPNFVKQGQTMDPATAFMRRIGDIGFMMPCQMDDQNLGNYDLMKVMPDTWNNVPWTVMNSVEVIKQACLEQRRLIEQIKVYSMDTSTKIMKSQYEFILENEQAIARLKGDINHMDEGWQKNN